MPSLDVVFDVPEWINQGLNDGSLERVGGVIRDQQGRVRAWLQEGSSVSSDSLSPDLLKQMGQLGIQSTLMIGLQVANLAVTTAGFVILYKKLNVVQEQLSKIGKDIQWLDYKQFEEQNSKLHAALNAINEFSLIHDKNIAHRMLIDSDRRLDESSRYFHAILQKGLQEDYRGRSSELIACYKAWIISSIGRINLRALQGELTAGLKLSKDLRALHANFGQFLKDLARRAPATELVEGKTLLLLKNQALPTHEILRGYAYQMEYINDNNAPELLTQLTPPSDSTSRLSVHIPKY